MLTEKYQSLSIQEQREFIGAVVHLCQTVPECFDNATQMLNWAQRQGYLDRVKILPEGWDNVPNNIDNQKTESE